MGLEWVIHKMVYGNMGDPDTMRKDPECNT